MTIPFLKEYIFLTKMPDAVFIIWCEWLKQRDELWSLLLTRICFDPTQRDYFDPRQGKNWKTSFFGENFPDPEKADPTQPGATKILCESKDFAPEPFSMMAWLGFKPLILFLIN